MLDDFSKEHKVLGPHLKNWADHYPFVAETKGGGTTIRPRRIIVTSNYSPEEIFEDQMTIDAIKRRFKMEYMPKAEWPPILRVEERPVVSERL